MVPRQTRYKRQLRGLFAAVFLSLFLFGGVFGICTGLWLLFFHHAPTLQSPLPLATAHAQDGPLTARVGRLCEKYHLSCSNISLHGNAIVLYVNTTQKVILSVQKDLPAQIDSLQLTISHLTIEGKQFKQLDFRFDKPVLTF